MSIREIKNLKAVLSYLNNLTQNFYIPYICEGFGFSAIGKFAEGIKVYIRNWDAQECDEQQGEWVSINKLLNENGNV